MREPERISCAVTLEAGAALELSLVERDRPAETALVRGHGRVVLDAADDEAPFDPEEVEGCHPDELHSLRLRRLDQGVPEIQRTVPIDPELVPELSRVAEPRHEDRDARDLDVLSKTVVREGSIREVLVCERLQHLPAQRSLQAQVRHLVRELADLDLRSLGESGEDLVVAVVCAAEADLAAGRGPAHDSAGVDHLPVLPAQRAATDLPRLELRDVPRYDAVHEVARTRPLEVPP